MNDVLSGDDVYRAILEHAADAIMVLKGDVFVQCNARALELFGCSREQFIGRTPLAFSPPRQPDERDSSEKALEKIHAALDHEPQRFEWLHTRNDGTLFNAEVALTRVDFDQEVLLVAVVRDITRRKLLEDAVHNIAAGISAATGQEYFNLLVRYIARALDASCAFVGELVAEGTIRTVALAADGQLSENIQYDLAGTPCLAVVGSRLCLCPNNVQHEFPDDAMLRDLQAESYIGVPLFDSNRQPLGLLAAVRRTPIEDPAFAEYIMRIFAARTAGEMERRKSLQKLLEEKKLTETIINSLPGIFYMIDRYGKLLWRNDTFEQAAGPLLEERGQIDVLQYVIEEDRNIAARSIQEAFQSGESSMEVRVWHGDGSMHTYYCTGARAGDDGSPYVVGAGIDITELKRTQDALRDSESDFRTIYENAPVGIFRSTVDGRLLGINAKGAAMFGYDSPEEMVSSVTHVHDQLSVHKGLRADFVRRVLSSDGFLRFENEFRRRDGSVFITDLYIGARRENGDVQFLEGFVEDITERKQGEADKRKFYRETILSVTDGKLTICDAAEIDAYLSTALKRVKLDDASGVSAARREVREFCIAGGLSGERLEVFLAGVGEAAANAVKHADGGLVSMGTANDAVWVGVSDHGSGIEHLTLPRAVLLRGFSTKPSLGVGYTVMLDVADRILLATGKDGTTVILVKELVEPACCIPLDQIPDSWEDEHPSG